MNRSRMPIRYFTGYILLLSARLLRKCAEWFQLLAFIPEGVVMIIWTPEKSTDMRDQFGIAGNVFGGIQHRGILPMGCLTANGISSHDTTLLMGTFWSWRVEQDGKPWLWPGRDSG